MACVSIFMLLPSGVPAGQAGSPPESPSVSSTQNSVSPRLSFGSRIILERLWTPQDLQRAWTPNPAETAPPANAKPLTSLPPVPPRWQNSIRGVSPVQGRKVVALTFDLCETARVVSGYDAGVVNYLRAHQVKATFLAGGRWLRSHPEKAMQLMADPLFEVGNHSWDHPHFQSLSDAAMADQVLKTQAQYEALWQELARRSRAQGIDPAEMDKIPRVPRSSGSPMAPAVPRPWGSWPDWASPPSSGPSSPGTRTNTSMPGASPPRCGAGFTPAPLLSATLTAAGCGPPMPCPCLCQSFWTRGTPSSP